MNPAADLTFAAILRAVLRQDPDVILVGEIRDKETAEIAMQAALTGHFVFTTLHANDAPTTVMRLLDIGIDASLIQSAVTTPFMTAPPAPPRRRSRDRSRRAW